MTISLLRPCDIMPFKKYIIHLPLPIFWSTQKCPLGGKSSLVFPITNQTLFCVFADIAVFTYGNTTCLQDGKHLEFVASDLAASPFTSRTTERNGKDDHN